MEESRHHIKARMLKNAARAWGYPEAAAENNFDPLVAMLLAACSTELEKISGEIHSSRARILERLVQLLSPDTLTGALPAHAVACALPSEDHTILKSGTQLFTRRKSSSLPDAGQALSKELFFSPTMSCRLNKASIRFMATGNVLYRIGQQFVKELIAMAPSGKELPSSTLWLAIDEPGVALHKSQFYFDLHNEADKNLFFHQLTKAAWSMNGIAIGHEPGYGEMQISGERLDIASIMKQDTDLVNTVKNQVNAFYRHSFITMLDDNDITTNRDAATWMPEILADVFGIKEAQILQKQPLRWISVQFPETISNRLLKDIVCIMNCFPVINSRLHEISYRLQDMVNIIPLQTDDLFLDLADVRDDEGQMLRTGASAVSGEESVALLMRNGGVGRFDERNAASIVDQVLHLLRDDSAAFSILGNDFMNGEMKQLQQIVNRLEQRLFSSPVHRVAIPYLVVRNMQKLPLHNLFIRYWSTNGTEGNNIRPGTQLQLHKGSCLEYNGAVLVTTTCGGRNKLTPGETVLAYKSAVLSKDRVISATDIKAFCHYQLGACVKNIKVEKGVMIHSDQRQGFQKTIDVHICVHKKIYNEMEESGALIFWIDNLKILLEERSASFMPYRIYMNAAA